MNKTISLCMIVKNEEKVLARCLDSVRDKVNEIIIVDTGSSDSTLKIARQYTEQIYDFEWVHDFSAARNESIKYASSDYILILDADEYLDVRADLQADLQTNLDYYLLQIRNEVSLGRTFSHLAARLFRNDGRLYYENRLHEHLNITETSLNFKGGQGQALIHHSGYNDETMIEKDKLNRNLPLMLKEVEENPTAYNLFNMGKTYLGIEKHEKAIEYFKRAYPLSHGRIFMPELLTKLAYCLGELNRPEEGLQILKDAVKVFPLETEMRYIQGRLYTEAGYHKDAIDCFYECIQMGDLGSTVTEGSGGYMAHYQLSDIYEQEGRLADSYNEIVNVLKLKRNFVPGFKKFLEITLKANISNEEVQQNVDQLYHLGSIEDLQFMFNILYSLRHPLLNHYMVKYKINAQSHIEASSKLYAKEYELSRYLWSLIDQKFEESGQDILLLSIILKDPDLFMANKSLLNLSNKEAEIINQIILGEITKPTHISTQLEDILLETARQLIVLREFDLFQSFSELLMKQKTKTKFRLCKLLSEYGFDEIAIDLLVKIFEEQSNNIDTLRLLGDLCYRNGYLEDAQLFYSKLLNLTSQYSSYERSYDLLQKMNDFESANEIKQEVIRLFPLANWILKKR
ncbi:glycosyltransferase [Paenibacillus sp. YPG26]|uniref:glycosyltransferase n=1 Tax=Paenibacillus sp. YPG26 TaxID=2878915 RepID=UPI00203D9CB4|nr:glycosyltransferase [Paenibacillus sp. YPG26]USB32837.1 glycosyltransferase [Paenibacillus sp. YPG26]